MEKLTLKVEGMSCEHCVKAVNDAVSALAGTANVKVELEAGTVTLELDSAKTTVKQIQAAIEEEGYTCVA